MFHERLQFCLPISKYSGVVGFLLVSCFWVPMILPVMCIYKTYFSFLLLHAYMNLFFFHHLQQVSTGGPVFAGPCTSQALPSQVRFFDLEAD